MSDETRAPCGGLSHGPLNCRQLTEQGTAFLEGTLSDDQWAAFRHHLELCPPCGEYVRQLGMTVEIVRALPGERGAKTREQVLERFASWRSRRG